MSPVTANLYLKFAATHPTALLALWLTACASGVGMTDTAKLNSQVGDEEAGSVGSGGGDAILVGSGGTVTTGTATTTGGGTDASTGGGGSSSTGDGGATTGSAGGSSAVGSGGIGGTGGLSGTGGFGGALPSGSGGAGGTPSISVGVGGGSAATQFLLDDMEDGDASIIPQGGRVGAWYSYNDETTTGMQTPPMGPAFIVSAGGYMSNFAAHTYGSGFKVWGAGMGFDLNNAGNNASTRQTYDVSGYTGIKFWIKGTSSTVRFALLTAEVVAVVEGGSCTMTCDDAYGVNIALTSTWTQHTIPFSQMSQENWGTPASFVPQNALALHFQAPVNTTFDYWVDDVTFY